MRTIWNAAGTMGRNECWYSRYPLSKTLGRGVEANYFALQVTLFPLERGVPAPKIIEVFAQTVVERL